MLLHCTFYPAVFFSELKVKLSGSLLCLSYSSWSNSRHLVPYSGRAPLPACLRSPGPGGGFGAQASPSPHRDPGCLPRGDAARSVGSCQTSGQRTKGNHPSEPRLCLAKPTAYTQKLSGGRESSFLESPTVFSFCVS